MWVLPNLELETTVTVEIDQTISTDLNIGIVFTAKLKTLKLFSSYTSQIKLDFIKLVLKFSKCTIHHSNKSRDEGRLGVGWPSPPPSFENRTKHQYKYAISSQNVKINVIATPPPINYKTYLKTLIQISNKCSFCFIVAHTSYSFYE